jgi:hypothetical protein
VFLLPSSDERESPAGGGISISRGSLILYFDRSGSLSFWTGAFGMAVRDAIGCPKTTGPTGEIKSQEIAAEIAVARENYVHLDGASFGSGNIP